MSFKIKGPPLLVENQGMTCYKVVKVTKGGIIMSPVKNYIYALGEQAPRVSLSPVTIKRAALPSYDVLYEGYHCYDNEASILHNWKVAGLDTDNISSFLIYLNKFIPKGKNYKFGIAKVIIPRGAVYYKNDNGEIVANSIIIQSI